MDTTENGKSGFRKLVEMSDHLGRQILDGLYVVSESRMNNILLNLEEGASRINRLEADNIELRKKFEEVVSHREQLISENIELRGALAKVNDVLEGIGKRDVYTL